MARRTLRHRHDRTPTGATRGLARAANLAEAKEAPVRIETVGWHFDTNRSDLNNSAQIEARAFLPSARCRKFAIESSK